jgi:cephalosporin hydroxylase
MGNEFYGAEYFNSLRYHYPELLSGDETSMVKNLHVGGITEWVESLGIMGVDAPDRFQEITNKPWASERSAQEVSGGGHSLRYVSADRSYKGLINLKTAIDLVLYSNLIWELQPRTILEFGSFQGGSALWFSDQLDALCGSGEVHSFELYDKCINRRASHARLHFHQADLRDVEALDRTLFAGLPHPWLVVDDAHENLLELVPFIAGFMNSGDYYVVEDVFLYHPGREPYAGVGFDPNMILGLVSSFHKLGFLVDAKYTDAFGQNVTTAPNGWLIKR